MDLPYTPDYKQQVLSKDSYSGTYYGTVEASVHNTAKKLKYPEYIPYLSLVHYVPFPCQFLLIWGVYPPIGGFSQLTVHFYITPTLSITRSPEMSVISSCFLPSLPLNAHLSQPLPECLKSTETQQQLHKSEVSNILLSESVFPTGCQHMLPRETTRRQRMNKRTSY